MSFQRENICAGVEDIKYVLHYVEGLLINKAASFHQSPDRKKGSLSGQQAGASGKLLWREGNASALKRDRSRGICSKLKAKQVL